MCNAIEVNKENLEETYNKISEFIKDKKFVFKNIRHPEFCTNVLQELNIYNTESSILILDDSVKCGFYIQETDTIIFNDSSFDIMDSNGIHISFDTKL